MSALTYAEYEQNFLVEDFEEDEDVSLEAFIEEPFDPTTQISLRYGFGRTNITITEELANTPLRDIIEQNQKQLAFRNINEISARNESSFVDQSAPPVVGTEYVLAAVGDSKGVLIS